MSKDKLKFSQFCNILNYVEQENPDFYSILHNLCMTGYLKTRKGEGLTFLMPDKNLTKQLGPLAIGDNAIKAVEYIKAMILKIYLPSIKDFEDFTNIPTSGNKKLPVKNVDVKSKKVILKNGAEIVPDTKFNLRTDRSGMAIYILQKDFVPVDSEAADEIPSIKKPKIGGYQFDNQDRKQLFEAVLECTSEGNPALEVLVSILKYLDKNNKKSCLEKITSKLSYDTLASLAIILRPFSSKNQDVYLSDEDFNEWKNMFGSKKFKDVPSYCICTDPLKYYEEMMKDGENGTLSDNIKRKAENLKESVTRATIIDMLIKFYSESFANGDLSPKQLLAEAELRAISFIIHDNDDYLETTNNNSRKYTSGVKRLFKMCTLDTPYLCSSTSEIMEASIAFYYSVINLVVRSSCLYYLPGYEDDTFAAASEIAKSENPFVNVGDGFKNDLGHLSDHYKTTYEAYMHLLN